nr:putative uncharacterized protein C6orf52 homolog isoform X2 [Ovis aries]
MAGQESFAGLGSTQQDTYYWYWQRMKPDFPSCQPHPFGIRYGSQYEQQQGGYPPGYSSGRGAGGNGPNIYSAYETSGHPAETSLLPKGSSRPRDRAQVSCIVSRCCTAEPPVPVERNDPRGPLRSLKLQRRQAPLTSAPPVKPHL